MNQVCMPCHTQSPMNVAPPEWLRCHKGRLRRTKHPYTAHRLVIRRPTLIETHHRHTMADPSSAAGQAAGDALNPALIRRVVFSPVNDSFHAVEETQKTRVSIDNTTNANSVSAQMRRS